MNPPDLTTEPGILTHLKTHNFPNSTKAIRLQDGFSAFVYRIDIEPSEALGGDGLIPKLVPKTVVVKHVEAYAARAAGLELDQSRLDYEQKALTALPAVLDLSHPDSVKFPDVLHYDAEAHVLVLQDLGDVPSLKAWLTPSSPVETCARIGASLGRFFAGVHGVRLKNPGVMEQFAGNETARRLSALVYYDNLPRAAEAFGYRDGFIAEAAADAAREVMEAKEVLTLGDAWPGNVLVSGSVGAGLEDLKVELYMIDLELSKPGTAAFDIGQMAAELYCMARFVDQERGGLLLQNFLREYRACGGQTSAAKVAIRVGAHFVVIGPMAWGERIGKTKLEELVADGIKLISAGWREDVSALQETMLAPLLDASGI